MFSIRCNCLVKLWGNQKKDPQRILKIKPFINKCNSEEINYPSEEDDRKKMRKIM